MNSLANKEMLVSGGLRDVRFAVAAVFVAILGPGCGSSAPKTGMASPNGATGSSSGGDATGVGGSGGGSDTNGGNGTAGSATGANAAPGSGSSSGPISPVSAGGSGSSSGNGFGGSSGSIMSMKDAGNTSGSDGAPPPSATPGGFPRNDMVDTNQMGPYQFMSYTDGLDNPAYASSIMYYPVDASPPYAVTVFSCGFTATKEGYQNFLGPLFASHGFAILLESPTTTADLPPTRAMQLEAGVQQIATENMRDGSPLKGKLAVDRVCLIGHSMGGGGTLIASQDEGNKIRCDSPLQPWEPGMTFPMIVAPTMFIAAQSDTVAPPASNALPFYMSIPSSTPKYYVEITGANHFLSSGDLGTNYDTQSKYLIAFYKVYLEDDMRYMSILTAMPDPALSQYMHNP